MSGQAYYYYGIDEGGSGPGETYYVFMVRNFNPVTARLIWDKVYLVSGVVGITAESEV